MSRHHFRFNNLFEKADQKVGDVHWEQNGIIKKDDVSFEWLNSINLSQRKQELWKLLLRWQDKTYGAAVSV